MIKTLVLASCKCLELTPNPTPPPSFAKVDLLPFVNDFHLEMEVTLDRKTFIFTLACSPRFSFGGPSDMVYELVRNYFVLDDYANGFDLFFKVCGHVA
jgi:hypothetical protein